MRLTLQAKTKSYKLNHSLNIIQVEGNLMCALHVYRVKSGNDI